MDASLFMAVYLMNKEVEDRMKYLEVVSKLMVIFSLQVEIGMEYGFVSLHYIIVTHVTADTS
jgi:hypothetical protein